MPTIEQRYEGAVAALTEIAQLAGRLAIAVAAHDPEAKKTLNRLRRDHINSAFRIAGDDASVKALLDELDKSLDAISRVDKSELPRLEGGVSAQRNLRERLYPFERSRKPVVVKMTKKDG